MLLLLSVALFSYQNSDRIQQNMGIAKKIIFIKT